MAEPIHIAAIDTGSNAIRVAICAASEPNVITPVVKERVPVRLGHNTFVRGELDPESLDDAVAAFARFRKLFDQHHVRHYRAVATSAVRNARNRDTLLHRVYHDAKIELEVIDGEEEARLVRRAVLGAFPVTRRPATIVDLGGGSLEITHQLGGDWQTASMRIGTVRLMETFGLTGSISPDEASMMGRYIASLLHSSLPVGDLSAGALTAACGGNAEELANLFGSVAGGLGMPSLSAAELDLALPKLLKYDVAKRMNKYGVRRDRAEVMGVAAIVFRAVMTELGLDQLIMPQVGIREGILVELAEAHTEELVSSDLARELAVLAAARNFATHMGHDISHSEHVRKLARALFMQLAELHELPSELGVIVELGALLHDVGEVVHRKGHHRHGEYLVNNGRIPGLEEPERAMVAAVVRAHRKSIPYPKKHLTYSTFGPSQREQVRRMAAIVRLADGLDSDHRQRVFDLRSELCDDRVVLHVRVAGDSGERMELRKADAFEAELGLPVALEVTTVPSGHRHTSARTE